MSLIAIIVDPNMLTSDARLAVERVIAEHAEHVERPMAPLWLVQTKESVDRWAHRLSDLKELRSEDRFLVIPLDKYMNGKIPRALWDWTNRLNGGCA